MPDHNWLFVQCAVPDDRQSTDGRSYKHAFSGSLPMHPRVVIGVGNTESSAHSDAVRLARAYDAKEN